jgi:hypothetical protein
MSALIGMLAEGEPTLVSTAAHARAGELIANSVARSLDYPMPDDSCPHLRAVCTQHLSTADRALLLTQVPHFNSQAGRVPQAPTTAATTTSAACHELGAYRLASLRCAAKKGSSFSQSNVT